MCVCACPCSTQSLRCVCRPFRLHTSCELSVSDVLTQCVWHTDPDSVCSRVCALSDGYTAPRSQYVESFRGVCTPTLQNQSDTLLPEIETFDSMQLLSERLFGKKVNTFNQREAQACNTPCRQQLLQNKRCAALEKT